MRFLHAADIHLDSPLAGLLAREDLPESVIRHCTRRAFAAMIDLALEEDAAFIVIAGDLYDSDWKDFSTGLFFAEQIRRFGRPCFLLRGNHDARSLITRHLKLPGNVREFSSRSCETFQLAELGVALHGHSFPNRAVPEDLSAGYRDRVEGMLNIGVLHTSAEDPGDHETYAPCRLAALMLKGYDYWALGHIHARRVLSQRPWIVFPGNIQGRNPKESGAKGCTLVTVEDGRITAVDHRAVDVLRWTTLEVDAADSDSASLAGRIGTSVHAAIEGADGRPLLARLVLTGLSDRHATLGDETDRLAAECRNTAIEAGGALWVESVRVHARPKRHRADDALAPLRIAFESGLDDTDTVSRLAEDLALLRQKVPAPARATLDLPETAEDIRRLADDAWRITADVLAATETP